MLSTAVESSGVQVCVESSSGVQSSPVQSSLLLCRMQLAVQWSPVESRFVLIVADSPVESRFVPVCSEVSII